MERSSRMGWIVSQIGAREHYAVPRSLQLRGTLQKLYTDVWVTRGRLLARNGPDVLRAVLRRHSEQIPDDRVADFTAEAMFREAFWRLRVRRPTLESDFEWHERTGSWFARRVADRLRSISLTPGAHRFFGFSTGCLETLTLLKSRGVFGVVDQIDPGRFEGDLVAEEGDRWPGWEAKGGRVPDSYYRRMQREWMEADLIVVNSEWSRGALIRQGAKEGKIAIVPLVYEPEGAVPFRRVSADSGKPLQVLFLGQVILRKGIQYLAGAARKLGSTSVQITVVGPIGISDLALRSMPSNMTVLGKVARQRVSELYRTADVFVLPTLSDGFALTQLEAMAHGVPVIATPNCGKVVDQGVDGIIVPAGDSDALADAIAQLDRNRELVSEMSVRATEKSKMFTLDRYATTLEAAVAERVKQIHLR